MKFLLNHKEKISTVAILVVLYLSIIYFVIAGTNIFLTVLQFLVTVCLTVCVVKDWKRYDKVLCIDDIVADLVFKDKNSPNMYYSFVSISNKSKKDITIVKVESSNENDFVIEEEKFTIPAHSIHTYKVNLKSEKGEGTYETVYTYTDIDGNTYTGNVSLVLDDEHLRKSGEFDNIDNYERGSFFKAIRNRPGKKNDGGENQPKK